ncbi:MAG: hydroxyacid dehydrogenase [Petrotogales bacterium]
MKSKIVITEFMTGSKLDDLKKQGEVIYDPDLWRKDELTTEVKDAHVVIVRNQTEVDASLINNAQNLKIIGRLGVGLDNIDLKAARSRDISVIYARNANAISVAEYVLGTMFQFSRKYHNATLEIKKGLWDRKKYALNELYGKKLGLIGVGEISARLAMRAKALGMEILGYDPFVPPYEIAIMDHGVQLCTLNEVVSQSDFISIHVPLNKYTKNMINKDMLSLMKSKCYVINTSRGGVINEEALYDALSSGIIAGAALDVYAKEPPLNSPILALDNVILTPHIAGVTQEAQFRTSAIIVDEVIKVLQGKQSLCVA